MTRAVFFDRDGTLMEEVHYCADPALVRLIPGTREALRALKQRGYQLFVITNQSGLGRGIITPAQYEAVHTELLRQLDDGHPEPLITATYFCPDAPPTPSPRRKPEPGMVFEAAKAHTLDLAASWFIGDKEADIGCGQSAGTKTIQVQTGYGKKENGRNPDFVAKDVVAAVKIILQNCDANN